MKKKKLANQGQCHVTLKLNAKDYAAVSNTVACRHNNTKSYMSSAKNWRPTFALNIPMLLNTLSNNTPMWF